MQSAAKTPARMSPLAYSSKRVGTNFGQENKKLFKSGGSSPQTPQKAKAFEMSADEVMENVQENLPLDLSESTGSDC